MLTEQKYKKKKNYWDFSEFLSLNLTVYLEADHYWSIAILSNCRINKVCIYNILYYIFYEFLTKLVMA